MWLHIFNNFCALLILLIRKLLHYIKNGAQDSDEVAECKYHIVCYNIMITSLKDIPQMLIVLIISMLHGFNIFGYISFGISIVLTVFKVCMCLTGKLLIGDSDDDAYAGTHSANTNRKTEMQMKTIIGLSPTSPTAGYQSDSSKQLGE